MRTLRSAVGTAALTVLATVALAAPAQADHVAELRPADGYCRMGGLESGIGFNVDTATYTHMVDKNGRTTGYVCHFRDLPPRDEWRYAPPTSGAYTTEGFGCWPPEGEYPLRQESRISKWTATPTGHATLVCKF